MKNKSLVIVLAFVITVMAGLIFAEKSFACADCVKKVKCEKCINGCDDNCKACEKCREHCSNCKTCIDKGCSQCADCVKCCPNCKQCDCCKKCDKHCSKCKVCQEKGCKQCEKCAGSCDKGKAGCPGCKK